MSTTATTPRREQGTALPVLVLVVGLALVPFGLIVLAFKSCASLGRESRAVRSQVLEATGLEWSPTIELGVGRGMLGLARAGLAFFDLPVEARAALKTVRGAEVGIYRLSRGTAGHARLLESTDREMTERGWERVVGVLSGRELVAIYLPADLSSARDVRLCVMVLEGEELVVVAGRANLEPLIELVRSQSDWHAVERHWTRF